MLAMDVVDTLRHQETLVERELDQETRDGVLKTRLREIYASQGLEVTDRILAQGIEALRESRFVYDRRGGTWPRLMALAWVRRGPVAIVLAALLVIGAAFYGWSAYQRGVEENRLAAARIELTETLPAELDRITVATRATAGDAEAVAAVDRLAMDAEAALAREEAETAKRLIGELEALQDQLELAYELRIVSRPGEPSGVFRIPDVNRTARNYYLIVEAIGPDGSALSLPITSEEDGSTATVSKFGVRVPRATYDAVAADKQADGIVDAARLGEKRSGSLGETYLMNVEDGRIREW